MGEDVYGGEAQVNMPMVRQGGSVCGWNWRYISDRLLLQMQAFFSVGFEGLIGGKGTSLS